jgi:hypothetical protein
MNFRMLGIGLLAVSLMPIGLSATPSHDGHGAACSIGGAQGKYGFTLTGTVILPTGAVPIAAVGRVALNANGTVAGTESRSVGGGSADETFTGTYTVNSDCTGSATVSFYEAGQLVRISVLSIVFDDHQNEIRMLQKSLQLPDGSFLPVVITVQARKILAEDDN